MSANDEGGEAPSPSSQASAYAKAMARRAGELPMSRTYSPQPVCDGIPGRCPKIGAFESIHLFFQAIQTSAGSARIRHDIIRADECR